MLALQRLACVMVTAAAPLCTFAQTTDAELATKIDAIAAKALKRPSAVGLSIAVARGDRVVFAKGYGKADLETEFDANKDTLFRIGSVTKQFTAAAVMKLVEQGKLGLDDTLATLLPDYPATPKPITVRQLLTHTSGIWSYTSDSKFMTRDTMLELKPAEVVATFKDHAPDFEPGAKWSYSNSGYYLLGQIIEKVSGKPYARYVQDEFFTPLGLRTRYESNREIIPNRAQGYSFEDNEIVNDIAMGADVPGAAGSLLSSAEGLVRWNIALSTGKVVSPKSYELMTARTTLSDGTSKGYGFGLGISEWEGRPVISHGGGIFGFLSQLSYYPKDHLAVAVISNSDSLPPSELAEAIATVALDIKEFVPADLDVPAEDVARFVGEYAFSDIPLELKVFEKDGKIWCQATGQKAARVLYQGKGEFRAEFDPKVKFVFPEGTGPAEQVVLHQRGEHAAKRKKP